MQNSSLNRSVLSSCLILGVVVCVCLSLVSLAGAGVILFKDKITLTGNSSPTATALDINQQMDQIEKQVSAIRKLDAKGSVDRQLLTPSELRQHVLDNFLKDYTSDDARKDARVLWTFGLLDKNFNLYDFYVNLYTEQIAGFYDQETKEMFVVQGEGFLGPERITYAHEFTHALQDQYYDIEKGLRFNDEACKHESERCAALSALMEGDASLAESMWFSSYATLADQKEVSEFYSNYQSPVYDSAPEFMKEDFLFPYQQGKQFVETLHNSGGWSAVDQAYTNPPTSTEQILHPDQYPGDIPEIVAIPLQATDLGEGWEEIDRGEMGEWYTSLILFAGLDQDWRINRGQAETSAAGWEGDSYTVFYNSNLDQTVMVLLTEWDDQNQAIEFQKSFQEYANKRFEQSPETAQSRLTWNSDQGIHSFYQQGSVTAWILTPQTDLAEIIWQSLPKP